MDTLQLTMLLMGVLFTFLAFGFWVGSTLFTVAFVAMLLNDNAQIGAIMANTTWGASSNWTLSALPLFVWMGEILFRTRLSEDLFEGLSPWLQRLPGGLLHVNILGCGIFAAVSGSSAATTATVGKMSLPELKKRGYDETMAIGTLAGSGTLGLLIPPSIILIVYGVAAEVSIDRLFMAGAIPGLMLICLFMGYTVIWSLLNRHKVPAAEGKTDMKTKLTALRRLLPVTLLIGFVIGSIYAGVATATEAATLGVIGALALTALTGSLSWDMFKRSLIGAVCTSCMITFILAGASFLTVAMAFTGIPRELAEFIGAMQLSPALLIVALTLFFVLLGCFLDGISVVVLTTSVILPLAEKAGFDLVWFGIYLVLVVEMSQITPPVGFNLFVIQSLTGRDIFRVARYATPFFLILVAAVALLSTYPEIALWLPQTLSNRG
ncbi:TRAP-type C4-dicarboxylate transport system, large permease component [Hahella chejuensis KCTC 2396]|uniref:TRAP transporter large permease protein n=1 Tax=Hahella chejuensis (strain KCTC 2396) TaxID=349521 RepID=Q2S8E7_HAHCH|nr:TRAP transporter large permease subunit [Hahella chejuensis]ABC33077.1 TRAP-type C4-dicarboxylate transport system, large permease component [Hahella chejuensis KCTC 2396]